MNPPLLLAVIGSLLLLAGCGGGNDPTGPTRPFCSSHPASAIVPFEDANLESAIKAALGLGPSDDLTCDLASGLTGLGAGGLGITSLEGVQSLTSLASLNLTDNAITDIGALGGLTTLRTLDLEGNAIADFSALSGLRDLTFLDLAENSITDISALSGLTALAILLLRANSITDIDVLGGLTSLTGLDLQDNSGLTDIQPLLNNTGLGGGDTVLLRRTSVGCGDVAALEAKGVAVTSDCP